jgi:hypothetical protein
MLLRGADQEQASALEAITRKVWTERTGAHRVEVRPLRTAAGATAYLVFHDRKQIQAPPAGVRVTRFRPSRNYFDRPVAELRAEAQSMLRERRLQRAAGALVDWEAVELERDPGYAAWEFEHSLAIARRDADMAALVKVNPRTGEIRPLRRAA